MRIGPDATLLERERELAVLADAAARAARGSGQLVVLLGEAGIGKTALLAAGAREVSAAGLRVLGAPGDELTREIPFVCLRELLEPEINRESEDLFGGAAALAAPVFRAHAGHIDVASVLHGLYWLLANIAERVPLALLIDDAHLLDLASGRFVSYLSSRIESLPVLAVLALRSGEADLSGGLERARVLRPRPLSEAGAATLVRSLLGPRADDDLCRACHEATSGNPFYLRELAQAIASDGVRPTVEVARRVRGIGIDAITQAVPVRLAKLGSDCARLAEALAVLAPRAPLRHAAELAGLDRPASQTAADAMRAAGLLEPGLALSFAHPIVREAVANGLPASRRAAMHGQAARVLFDDGAPADQVAAHLLTAEPFGEPWVVELLRRAGSHALARGAPEAAVAYLQRALEEPPAPEARLDVLLELGRAQALLPGEHEFTALREALELADEPGKRAEVALELAFGLVQASRFCDVAELLEEQLARSDVGNQPLAERLEAVLIGAGAACLPAARRVLARMAPQLERARCQEVRDPVLLAALAQTGVASGLPAEQGAALAELALRDASIWSAPQAVIGVANTLVWTDRLREAAAVQDAAIAEAQRIGSAPLYAEASILRAETAWRAGDLDLAEDHARRAHPLGVEFGLGPFAVMFLVAVLLELGGVEEAAELVESVDLLPQPRTWQALILLAERGRVKLARGETRAAAHDLLEAARRMTVGGCQLSVVIDWVPNACLALTRLGDGEAAERLAELELGEAREFGASRRLGIALSNRGLLDPGQRGVARLREGVHVLRDSPARLEHARALVNLGAGLRQRGQPEQARAALADGLDLAVRCGGTVLADQARDELRATGARPRRDLLRGTGSLTPAELRTARLAAGGLANKQIAQTLFVSTKTVEAQLSQTYAKLAIHGRAELRGALASKQ